MFCSVSIKYGYLGKKFLHRLHTEIASFTDSPVLICTSDLYSHVCQEWMCWCTGTSCIGDAFLKFNVKKIFANKFFLHWLMLYWKDVPYKASPPLWSRREEHFLF